MPFFLYLKQHLFFGFIQLEVQLLLQIDEVFEIFIIGLFFLHNGQSNISLSTSLCSTTEHSSQKKIKLKTSGIYYFQNKV